MELRWIRVLGLSLAALLMLGQGSGAAHMLLVEHVRCVEHGELVHADETAHWATPVRASASGRAWQSRPRSEPEHAHNHCAASHERRDAAPDPVEAGFAAAPPDSDFAFVSSPPSTQSHTAPLRLAPKTSPPA